MAKLDVRNFSNIFDKGITDYAKFNWLSDGLPDGTYNGITKVTIDHAPSGSAVETYRLYAPFSSFGINPIGGEALVMWSYGFSNYEIDKTDNFYQTFRGPRIGFTSSNLSIQIDRYGTLTLDDYNAYLAKHPIVLCYYDKNDYAVTDLGTCTWNKSTTYNTFYTYSTGIKQYAPSVVGDIHMFDKKTIKYNEMAEDIVTQGTICGGTNNNVFCYRATAEEMQKTVEQFKTYMSGKYLIYKK